MLALPQSRSFRVSLSTLAAAAHPLPALARVAAPAPTLDSGDTA